MTYNKTNLPARFLTPPVAPPHQLSKATWKRNWNIYHVYTNWDGTRYGLLNVLARWVRSIDHKPQLSRQRIETIAKNTHWLLRDQPEPVGTMEEPR
jgi:hypothetical protein